MSLIADIYLGKKILGLNNILKNQPRKNLSIDLLIGACFLVKKEIAAPVQNIVGLKLTFFFKYKPKISCVPPPILVKI